jgi:hypothetical protein
VEKKFVKIEVMARLIVKVIIFRDLTPGRLVEIHRRLEMVNVGVPFSETLKSLPEHKTSFSRNESSIFGA